MKNVWDELGYGHLALSSQNLRDKAATLERTVGNVSRDIVRNVGRADGTRLEREETRKTLRLSLLKVWTKMVMSCEGERAQICI